jgi:type I restriction enzyme S subunit
MSNATTHIEIEKRSAERSRSKLVPALRFKEFDGEWDLKRLASSIEIVAGYAFKSTEMENTPSTYQIIKMSNVYKSKLQLDRSPSYWEKIDKKQAKFLLRKKDILLTLTGTVGKKDYGYSIVIPENNKFLLNQRLVYLRYIENVSDGDFINNLIKTSRFFYFFFNESKGGTGNQTNVGIEDLKNIKLSFPALPEQQKIASFLSAVDEKIQQLTKKKSLLEQYKKGVMQQLFPSTGSGQRSGQLRFKPARPAGGDENLSADRHDGNPYPEWKEKKISQVVTEVNERTIENNQFEVLSSTKSGIVLQSEYFNKQVASSDSSNYKIVRKGMFSYRSMSDTGSFTFNIQNVIEIGIVSPAYPVFKVNENQSAFYLYLTLNNSSHFKSQLLAMMEGGTRLALGFSKFKKMIVHLPSFEEQQKIATYLSSIDTKIEAVNTQITQTQTFKKGLLQQMFV